MNKLKVLNSAGLITIVNKDNTEICMIDERGNFSVGPLNQAVSDMFSLHISNSMKFDALLGMLRLRSKIVLIFSNESVVAGTLFGYEIYEIKEWSFIQKQYNYQASDSQKKADDNYFKLVMEYLKSTRILFSNQLDLTQSVQREFQRGVKLYDGSEDYFNQLDRRFVWNHHLLKPLIEEKMFNFITPVVNGVFQYHYVSNGVKCILISRRSVMRDGTRFQCRGIDCLGNVANFVETEVILSNMIKFAAVVLTRGSMPIFWRQEPNLSWSPPVVVHKKAAVLDASAKHFDELQSIYGNIVLVNLIKRYGKEGMLEKETKRVVLEYNEKVPVDKKIQYINFEFNKKAKEYTVTAKTVNEIFEQLEDVNECFFIGQFKPDGIRKMDPEIISLQKKTFRVNCMDCIDRTNLVQYALSARIISEVFKSTEIDFKFPRDFENLSSFRILWLKNGQQLSVSYTGTEALKQERLKFYPNKMEGYFQDGINAASRYFLSNFKNGEKCDAINVVQGKFNPVLQPNIFKKKYHDGLVNIKVALFVFLATMYFLLNNSWPTLRFFSCKFFVVTILSVINAIFLGHYINPKRSRTKRFLDPGKR